MARNGTSVLSTPAWAALQSRAALLLQTHPNLRSLETAAFSPTAGGNVSLSAVQAALSQTCPRASLVDCVAGGCSPTVCELRALAYGYISPSGIGVNIALRPPHESSSKQGYSWAKDVVTTLKQAPDDGVLDWFYIGDSGYVDNAVADYVYELMPSVVGALAAVLAIILGVAFRSISVPLRAVFTIGVTLVVVFGSISAVCNGGYLDYTNTPFLTSSHGVFWLMPILGLVIAVGLGIDYDVFVVTKIQEEFEDGWETDAAIIRGVARSGGIISYAGAIQAIATPAPGRRRRIRSPVRCNEPLAPPVQKRTGLATWRLHREMTRNSVVAQPSCSCASQA